MNVPSVPLSGLLKAAAEAFFQTDLSGLELHFGSRARRFRAAACAWGNDIYISVPLATRPSALLELVGHELTHVVQQRQGRVRQTTTIAGCPANDDPALEQEAVELGRRFARGMDAPLPQRAAAGFQPVLQRSVTVGDQVLSNQASLGNASIIVDLIDGGASWLSWAIGNPDARYPYADAGSLVAGVQSGLHGTDLMLLRQLRLLLHPLKLMELDADELLLLAAAEQRPDAATLRQATKILNKRRVYSQAELQVWVDFLLATGVRDQPVFSNLTLAGQLALFAMIDEASDAYALNSMLQKEAASFAVIHAQSVFEFVDYYKFYMTTIDDPTPAATGAAARLRKADSLQQSMEPLLYGYLLCPSFPGVLTPDEVIASVQRWFAAGNVLGFPRLSQGLTQIAHYADLHGAKGQTTSALIQSIQQFSAQSRSLFKEKLAGSVELTQDGRERFYSYQGPSGSVQLRHSSDGDLTLASFRASS